MSEKAMLSTKDNPWNPFLNFQEWLNFDLLHGYDCSGYLMRLAHTSDDLSEEENAAEINNAILRIIDINPDLYIRVTEPQ